MRRRRLVVVTVTPTFPPRRGNQVRSAGLLANLGENWEVEAHALMIQRTDLPFPRRRIRVGERWTDVRERDPLMAAWTVLTTMRGYPPAYASGVLSVLPHRRLRRALAGADAVWVAPPYHAEWVRAHTPPHVPLLFDEHSVEAHMYRPRAAWWTRRLAAEVERSERAALSLADAVLVTSDEDGEVARAWGARDVTVVPNAVDLEHVRPPRGGEREAARRRLGLPPGVLAAFVGSGHPPNVRAVTALERHAAAFAAAGVTVVAAGRSSLGRAPVAGMLHLGEVPDVAELLRAVDIALCPLLDGSGTSLKTVEYLAAGLPLVSTAVGVRGLEVTDGRHAVVCDVDAMPAAAAALAADPERAARLGEAARALAAERYGWRSAGARATAVLDRLVADRPRRVLFLASSADLYGSDMALLRTVRAHVERGGTAVVATPDRGPLVDRLREAGASVHVLPLAVLRRRLLSPAGLSGIAVRLLRSRRALLRIARTARVDVVHSNTSAVVSGAVVARALRVPHVWTVREDLTRPAGWVPATLVSRGADVVVAVSDSVRRGLEARVPAVAARVRVVRDGVDVDRFAALPDRGAALRALGLRDERPVVAMLARVNAWKGQGVLVDAAAELRRDGFDVQVLLAGDVFPGDEEVAADLRRRIARHGLGDRVRMLGFVEDPAAVLAAADVVAAPSTAAEPYGLAVVDALTAGRPVVASAVGGHLETVRDGVDGLLVQPGDPHALAVALRRILGDTAMLRAMTTAARRDRARFDIVTGQQALWAVYEEALDAGRR